MSTSLEKLDNCDNLTFKLRHYYQLQLTVDLTLTCWSTQPALSTTCNHLPSYCTCQHIILNLCLQEFTSEVLLQQTAHLLTWVIMNFICKHLYSYIDTVYWLTATCRMFHVKFNLQPSFLQITCFHINRW